MTKSLSLTLIIVLLCLIANSQPGISTNDKKPGETVYREAKKEFLNFEQKHGASITTNNVRMHYLTWGSPSDTPLIWSHGSLTNAYELIKIADGLVKAGYYVIGIDYYGHGQTPLPKHPVSLYHIADDIKFLMDKLKIEKAVIGGWSRGGAVSTAFYDAYPEKVLGLILEDGGSVSINTDYHKMENEKLKTTLQQIEKEFPGQDTSYATEFDAYRGIYDTTENGNQFQSFAWIQKNASGRYAVCPGVLELFNMKTAAQWSNNILRPTQSTLFAESFSILEPKIIYRNLQVPMLILDPIIADDFMKFEDLNASLKNAHPELIDHIIYQNTGHNIHYEKPKEFVKDLSSFLAKVKQHNKH